jgi:multidrug efflux pump subunit AcrB
MSFHLSTWSIKNPVPVIVLFFMLALLGVKSFVQLGIDSFPNIDIPAIRVVIFQQGASPSELESQVAKKVEDAVAGLENIDRLVSTIRDEISVTSIGFAIGTDTDRALNDVRNAVSQVRQELPQDINEPVVEQERFYRESVMAYAVTSDSLSVAQLSELVDEGISRRLLKVKGVAEVKRIGGVDREVRVNLDSQQLQAFNITSVEVNDQMRGLNVNLPSGRSEVGNSEESIRTLGGAKTIDELKTFRISLLNGDSVPLSSLGEVIDSYGDPRQSAFLNNKAVVAFTLERSTGSTLVTVEENVRQAVEELKSSLAKERVKIKLIFTRADAIRNSYQATILDLFLGCILTVVTVGLFLRDVQVTLITAIALPLSIIPTFWIMQTLGYTLNNLTLLGLALAVGNLIDDAVCMMENIDHHLHKGKNPYQAAIEGAQEIGWAVLATAATIIAVFVPVAFMGGVPGQFFLPFGVTVSVSTLFSTLVAITITPMLSAYWLKNKQLTAPENNFVPSSNLVLTSRNNKILLGDRTAIATPHINASQPKIQPYRSLLIWSLHHRMTAIAIALIFFIFSLQLIPYIPQGLSGTSDNSLSMVSVELPPGSRLQETETIMSELVEILKGQSVVESVLVQSGNDNQVNNGVAYVKLVPREHRKISQRQFEEQMREKLANLAGARISFNNQGLGVGKKQLAIVLKGEKIETLEARAKIIEQEMRQISGLVEVSSSISLLKPEIAIEPDREKAADLGVSTVAIARAASIASLGGHETNLAKFNLGDRLIPIRVQLDPEERTSIDTLQNLQLRSNKGELVPLSAVATIRLTSSPLEIKRLDRSRQVTLEANLQGIALGDALKLVRALPGMQSLPQGISEEPIPGGDAEIMRDVFTRFSTSLTFGILCIYAILVVLYNNFIYPIAILIALPFSIGGTFLGLLVAQKELGVFALIGIVLLMGLATKNAILLVDFALSALKEGKNCFDAAIEAGVSRLRPIVMTSIATIVGMLPIALEIGADGEMRSPMAVAVIGGFTSSTLLTLVIVPVLFVIFYLLIPKSKV